MLKVSQLTKRWPDGTPALENVSFTAELGTITALIGPSGSGKSTLLRVVSGLDKFDGGSMDNPHGDVGMVFQQPSLWPHLTLIENIVLPLRVIKGMSQPDARRTAVEVLTAWGLEHRFDARPSELSGGQQQRGAIARTIVMRPKVLCLDEITSSLDPEITADILTRLLHIKGTNESIMLLATHHLGFVRDGADQIIFMEAGRVVETGDAAKVLESPENLRTQQFIKAAKLV